MQQIVSKRLQTIKECSDQCYYRERDLTSRPVFKNIAGSIRPNLSDILNKIIVPNGQFEEIKFNEENSLVYLEPYLHQVKKSLQLFTGDKKNIDNETPHTKDIDLLIISEIRGKLYFFFIEAKKQNQKKLNQQNKDKIEIITKFEAFDIEPHYISCFPLRTVNLDNQNLYPFFSNWTNLDKPRICEDQGEIIKNLTKMLDLERYRLLGTCFDLNLSQEFIDYFNIQQGVKIPNNAFVSLDVTFDKIFKTFNLKPINHSDKISDIDLIIAHEDQNKITKINLFEAKCCTPWNNKQAIRKRQLLFELFGCDGKKIPNVQANFYFFSPKKPPDEILKKDESGLINVSYLEYLNFPKNFKKFND